MNTREDEKKKLRSVGDLVGWVKLCKNVKDMAGNDGVQRPVSLDELSRHNTESDPWTAIRGGLIFVQHANFHLS